MALGDEALKAARLTANEVNQDEKRIKRLEAEVEVRRLLALCVNRRHLTRELVLGRLLAKLALAAGVRRLRITESEWADFAQFACFVSPSEGGFLFELVNGGEQVPRGYWSSRDHEYKIPDIRYSLLSDWSGQCFAALAEYEKEWLEIQERVDEICNELDAEDDAARMKEIQQMLDEYKNGGPDDLQFLLNRVEVLQEDKAELEKFLASKSLGSQFKNWQWRTNDQESNE